MVEAANVRIKRWKYLDHILLTSQIPFIVDFVRIVCAVSNKYLPPINATEGAEEDQVIVSCMLERLSRESELQSFVEEHNLDRCSVAKWSSVDDFDMFEFPKLDEVTLRLLILGTYQLKLSTSYIQEYVGCDCEMQLFLEVKDCSELDFKVDISHLSLTYFGLSI